MDIKRAKKEIRDSIEAYLKKDEYGEYMIPSIRQRPILLMGPPGIGKTQIMEQVAKECGISLVAYTITHHTRQSAVGLPFIKERVYAGQAYSITEYTMSEIIASVYEKIEKTGVMEGILFIDEINCVSETLAPTMLQFLQCKTFGNRKVPDGWTIVAAGNPPEYNKSVREFDVVTLDRIKKIDVEENYHVWREYAYQAEIHPAVMAYLELRKEHFYRVETTVDGKVFATARGWEDLSQFMKAYELTEKKIDREIVGQYIQHPRISKEFANYYELYQKYRKDYKLEQILQGRYTEDILERLKFAAFDERLSVIGLLLGKLGEYFRNCYRTEKYVEELFRYLKEWSGKGTAEDVLKKAEEDFEALGMQEQLTKGIEITSRRVTSVMRQYVRDIKERHLNPEESYEWVKERFACEADSGETEAKETARYLENAFRFIEKAFGEGQEMVVFLTELNTNYYSALFIGEHGSAEYDRYNRGLLLEDRRGKILSQLEEAETLLNKTLK